MPPTLGVCSWSLNPEGPADLIDRVRLTGCDAIQVHLDPLRTGAWPLSEFADRMAAEEIVLRSGMMTMEGEDYTTLESIARTGGVRPKKTWEINRQAAHANAEVAQALGISLVTFHAGHLPAAADHPERAIMVERLRDMVEIFGDRGIRVGFETGQETADSLSQFLDDIPGAGVNFDPANMILYGMGDPYEAIEALASHVVQIHIKDALPAIVPGVWGTEVPVGQGHVDWRRFLRIVNERVPAADWMIERESGEARIEDVASACALLRSIDEDSV